VPDVTLFSDGSVTDLGSGCSVTPGGAFFFLYFLNGYRRYPSSSFFQYLNGPGDDRPDPTGQSLRDAGRISFEGG
jgi:hypothetical protein